MCRVGRNVNSSSSTDGDDDQEGDGGAPALKPSKLLSTIRDRVVKKKRKSLLEGDSAKTEIDMSRISLKNVTVLDVLSNGITIGYLNNRFYVFDETGTCIGSHTVKEEAMLIAFSAKKFGI